MTTPRPNRIIDHRIVKGRDLLPNPANWRTHPPQQRAATVAALDRLGYVDELKVVQTPDGLLLLDGHMRAEIGEDDDIPVAVVDLDEEEQRIMLATFDPITSMAYGDLDAYARLGVTSDDEGLQALIDGVQSGEHIPLLADDDYNVREPNPEETFETGNALNTAEADDYEPVTKRGQVFALGDHRLMCGDATSDIEVLLGSAEIGLVITDPPYGVNIVKGLGTSNGAKPFGRVRQRGGKPSGILKGKDGVSGVVEPRLYAPITGDDKPFDPTWLLTLGKNQVIFGAGYFGHGLPEGTALLCWDKGISDEATFSGFELAWTSFPGRYRVYRHRWSGMIRAGSRDEELKDRVHPTQKPVGLIAEIIKDLSPGGLICDPYLGSGTTIIAAEKLGRRCYAMEIEPRYVDVAIRRWEDYTGKKAELLKSPSPSSA